MLNRNRKDQIKLEEQYRLEVRNQLQETGQVKRSLVSSISGTLWSGVNSNFGLWLLSAIFITGAGFLYAHWQNSRAEERENSEAIQKLDSEISYRYSQILIQLYNLTDEEPNGKFVLKKDPRRTQRCKNGTGTHLSTTQG